MIAIGCEGVSLSFGGDVILEKVSFTLNEGEKLGIVGVNGAGKSTLLRLITGEYQPTSGLITVQKDKTLGILSQNVGFDGEGTVLAATEETFTALIQMEQDLEGLRIAAEGGDSESGRRYSLLHERFVAQGGYEFRSRCRGILKNLGFPEEQWGEKISSLSGGQKTRLALTCLLLRSPDILLLDEPTNHLDVQSLFWLEDYLKNSRKTVLVVSHDRYFLDRVTTKTLEIEHGKGKLYAGNYSFYAEHKRIDRQIQESHYKNQQKEIARIEAHIEQQRRWGREKNIIRAESRQKQLDKMERVERPDALPTAIRMSFRAAEQSGEDVMRAKNLSKSYPGRPLFESVSFSLTAGERLFITGENGCGKSTLIRMLSGTTPPETGEIEYGYHVSIGYYDQENQNLTPHKTVLDELWDHYPTMTETEVRSALALFNFRGEEIEKKVSVLSGGERARLTLVKLMLAGNNLLILDEPTNHLDIASREVLEEALIDFDGTLIAVSHDRYFVSKLASRILDFGAEQAHRLFDYQGTYEEYLAYKRDHLSPIAAVKTASISPPTAAKEDYLRKKAATAERRKKENRLTKAKAESEQVEARIAEIDAYFQTTDGTDYVELAEMERIKTSLEDNLFLLYEEIEMLSEELSS